MAGNQAVLEFAGDATKLRKAGQQSEAALSGVGDAATAASKDLAGASSSATEYTTRVGKLGDAVGGATDAIDAAGAAVQAMVDIQNAGRERAMRLARANADVEQAMIDSRQAAVDLRQAQEDLNQSQLDGKQAAIDLEQSEIDARQAKLDVTTAQKDYNKAVKEHGAGSAEARQAAIDLSQAQSDLKQATLDSEQAQADARQAQIDGKQATVDATQAVRDGKDAQLDLNDAMSAANPTGLQKFAENLNLITPILSGVVGVIGLVTAAQWAWNIAQLASPTTWIILAIVALIGVIVLIATKTDWFQRLWKFAWGGIKDAAAAVGRFFRDTVYEKWILGAWNGIKRAGERVWEWMKALPGKIKGAFASIANFISAPYRAAFNLIASAWNNTIGRLSFTFPGWIPGLGGNTISVPQLPHFHSGVRGVPGPPGSEMLAVLQAGETVSPASSAGGGGERWIRLDMGPIGDALLAGVRQAVESRGGRVTALGVSVIGGEIRT